MQEGHALTRGSVVEQRPAVAALSFGLVAAAMVMSLWLSFAAAIPGVVAFSLGRLARKEQRPYAVTSILLGCVGCWSRPWFCSLSCSPARAGIAEAPRRGLRARRRFRQF